MYNMLVHNSYVILILQNNIVRGKCQHSYYAFGEAHCDFYFLERIALFTVTSYSPLAAPSKCIGTIPSNHVL